MQLSTRGRYAVVAMVDLAAREITTGGSVPVRLAEIAVGQHLSHSYLEQLFNKLRRADLVRAARGPGGGYRLARSSKSIAIADIVAAVDEPIVVTRCTTGGGGCLSPAANSAAIGDCPRDAAEIVDHGSAAGVKCQTHDLWHELGRQIALFLTAVTLADVVLGNVAGRALIPSTHGAGGADPE